MEEGVKNINDPVPKSSIVGPLNFLNPTNVHNLEQLYPTSTEVPCIFCDKTFTFYAEKHEYLAHLYLNHRLIIGDEDQVAILHEYLKHWHHIFTNETRQINEFCTTMVMDQLPDGTPSKGEKYYLLCDVSPHDHELRQNLRKRQLEIVLSQLQFERTDHKFERNCLFCREVIKSTRCNFIEHLFEKHFLQLGKAENLVFIDELIDMVQTKLNDLICIFCEKTFKDRPTLKEHMRKKGHKRINPDNKSYDRFFLINYQNKSVLSNKKTLKNLIKGKTKEEKQNTSDGVLECDSDTNWSDWEGEEQIITCLFCTQKNSDFTKLKDHMKMEHKVDFDLETEKMTFYDRVKIVNFVRRSMYTMECVKCKERFENIGCLQHHLNENNHFSLGEPNDWNLPQYFFPTYEDDTFLQNLDNTNFDEEADTWIADSVTDPSITVYSEDSKVNINLDAEALSIEQIKID